MAEKKQKQHVGITHAIREIELLSAEAMKLKAEGGNYHNVIAEIRVYMDALITYIETQKP